MAQQKSIKGFLSLYLEGAVPAKVCQLVSGYVVAYSSAVRGYPGNVGDCNEKMLKKGWKRKWENIARG